MIVLQSVLDIRVLEHQLYLLDDLLVQLLQYYLVLPPRVAADLMQKFSQDALRLQ